MSGSTSAADLLRIAARVREQALMLRAISVRITIAAATARWQSPAAAGFRERIRDVALALRVGANGLDDAADELARYAARAASAASHLTGAAR